ncbi:hypothetical protein O181_129638 [Austropuccinia psidii MF-1]|uniref:Uncharacterized protein n=1 Tax=Austropuccinia psidii MF-1 TaxID=1389203 RepID=A0A9Q3Q906_9BASI|nr:hypothetical protein [Austropuccinia psidii MF-1]
MPKISLRKKAIKDLCLMCLITHIEENGVNILKEKYGKDNQDTDEVLKAHHSSQSYNLALNLTMHSRYLSIPSQTIAHEAYNIDVLFKMQEDVFKKSIRTLKDGFI